MDLSRNKFPIYVLAFEQQLHDSVVVVSVVSDVLKKFRVISKPCNHGSVFNPRSRGYPLEAATLKFIIADRAGVGQKINIAAGWKFVRQS